MPCNRMRFKQGAMRCECVGVGHRKPRIICLNIMALNTLGQSIFAIRIFERLGAVKGSFLTCSMGEQGE